MAATRKKTTQKKAVAKKKAPTRKKSTASRPDTASQARSGWNRSRAYSTGGSQYLRLGKNDNIIRIIFDESDPQALPYFEVPTFMGAKGDLKYFRRVDLEWLIEFPDLVEIVGDRMTDTDREMIRDYGDPNRQLLGLLDTENVEVPKSLKQSREHKPTVQTRVYWNAILNGNQGLFETSYVFRKEMQALEAEYPTVADPKEGFPVKIVGEGDGLGRSYTAPIPLINQAEEVSTRGAIDLRKVVARLYVGYEDAVRMLFQSYGPWIDLLPYSLTEQHFGM